LFLTEKNARRPKKFHENLSKEKLSIKSKISKNGGGKFIVGIALPELDPKIKHKVMKIGEGSFLVFFWEAHPKIQSRRRLYCIRL
jgi:hypothetical protein